jgi:hypothetical protein
MLTPMGSRWTATEVGPAKQPRRPFWRPFEPIPYTKHALRAKIVIDLIYPPRTSAHLCAAKSGLHLLFVDLS